MYSSASDVANHLAIMTCCTMLLTLNINNYDGQMDYGDIFGPLLEVKIV
jgi:hypothetical protein